MRSLCYLLVLFFELNHVVFELEYFFFLGIVDVLHLDYSVFEYFVGFF